MTDDRIPDLHDHFERMLDDEPPHRDPVAAAALHGRTALRRRRTAVGAAAAGGVLAVVAVAGIAAASLPGHGTGSTTAVPAADGRSATSTPTGAPTGTPTATPDPDARSSYTYSIAPDCPQRQDPTGCGYDFTMDAVRPAVVAAVEVRLTDGTTKRVTTDDGSYRLDVTGPLPAGDVWSSDGSLEHDGQPTDLFAGLTLYAADGHVLARATSTRSGQLDPYLEICDRLSPQDATQCPG